MVIVGARFWLIGNYGSDLPYWDQWDAEGAYLYKPLHDGTLSFLDWFAPHNEHRVFFTRIISYILQVTNGQWDARVQMVVNSSFYALVACGIFLLFAKGRGYVFGLFWSVVLAAIFSCPFGWENTLAGFQSQFYLLTAFSLAVIWLLINASAWSWRWVSGVILGFCTLFTMASGLLAPLAVLLFVCLSLARERQNWMEVLLRVWPTVVACFLILVAGFLLLTKVEGHAELKAHGPVAFLNALSSCLSWPWIQQGLWGIICWLPALLLVVSYLLRRVPDGKEERFLITATAWVVLQAAATAYSRAIVIQSSRYSDIFSFGIVFNLLCASVLFRNRIRSVKGVIWLSLILASLAVNALGMYRIGFNGELAKRKAMYEVEKFRTSGYVATNDFGFLTPVQAETDIPYPVPEKLANLLRDPALDPILPVSVRKALIVTGQPGESEKMAGDYNLEAISPYPWEKLWPFPASELRSGNFHYVVKKTQGLPFLHLFVAGDAHKIRFIDSNNRQHGLSVLSGTGEQWQEAYVYCPGTECRIETSGTAERILFSEPKEMGALSLAALLITSNSRIFLLPGLFGFFCLIILCLLKRRREPHAETQGKLDLQTN